MLQLGLMKKVDHAALSFYHSTAWNSEFLCFYVHNEKTSSPSWWTSVASGMPPSLRSRTIQKLQRELFGKKI